VQAGDKSGHIDDLARGAIAKFAHIHFAPSKDACKRLKNWGEKKNRIFFTGAPQLDDIRKKKVKIKNFYVVIYHPILNEQKNLKNQLSSLLKAIKETDLNVIWIYPNTDMGFKSVISILKKSKNKKIKIISNLERSEFLDILNQSSGIIGNSSAGIIEASIFKKPVINIGNRQNERPQSCNIVNCDNNKKDIIKKINFVKKNKKFLNNLNSCKNPYYRKNSSEIIYRIINSLKKNDKIFNKY
jgi:GDP/UDP-N,N'-diacetylbacillosamine 2-epimerase (hydrolysing)